MLTADPNHIAGRVLRKLHAFYSRPNLEELVMNRPGYVWIKDRGSDWQEFEAPELTYDYIFRLCKVLANINNAKFSEADIPIVSCELPGAPFRFQAVVGSNVRYSLDDRVGVALAIRSLMADTRIDFSSYGLVGDAQLPGSAAGLLAFDVGEDHIEALHEIIARHESIIVSGATSTGKTTFTNKVIELIPENERIITVEDARELSVLQRNRVHMMVPRTRSANAIGYPEIIDSLVRLTPDWIICGELSIANAQPIYATMGKGHPVITTVHAGSPAEAIAAFANNMSIAGADIALSGRSLYDSIASQVGAVIQLERRDGRRRVVDIAFPSRDIARKRNS
ncbi:ATPase, T2SS/T4P/T4SS family [Loktanella sp. DJP18]|uniref:ATPase, T2SS/T4P/T4SS family n=1 Tax=Loktanella sp. DJP18 TaxID=3409788 RepID=UPI003BB60B6D